MTDLAPARARLARAAAHLRAFRDERDQWWATSQPWFESSITDDRLTGSVRLRVREDAPIEQWSLTLGDAIHNARAALDVLVWTNSQLAGLSESQQKRICWPVLTSAAAAADDQRWKGVLASELRGVSNDIAAAIRSRQSSLIDLLHQLDIEDKHRLTLAATIATLDVEHEFKVEYVEPDAPKLGAPTLTLHPSQLCDGDVLIEHGGADPIKSIEGSGTFRFGLALIHRGVQHPAWSTVEGLIAHVAETIDSVGAAWSEHRG